MRYLTAIVTLALPALIGDLGSNDPTFLSTKESVRKTATALESADSKDTILLVSLDDGSVIMQTIESSADICFKTNTDSSTTCLTRGAPVIEPATNAIIGFEMIQDQIDLIAK